MPVHFSSFVWGIFLLSSPTLGATVRKRRILQQEEQDIVASCSATDYKIPSGIKVDFPFNTPPFEKASGIYAGLVFGITPAVGQFETPVALRAFSLLDASGWNCVAAYSGDDKHDALRPTAKPIVTVPPQVCNDAVDAHTTDARVQCLVHVYAAIAPTIVQSLDSLQRQFDKMGYNATTTASIEFGIMSEVQACGTIPNDDEAAYSSCMNDVAARYFYTPRVMGSIIAQDTLRFAFADGWNMDGTNEGKCTHNCRPYADTIGYRPRNTPGSEGGSLNSILFKNRWQPLLEDDGRGFFYRQEHVTPHIGFRGRPRILTWADLRRRRLSNPRYNYVNEAALVTERLSKLNDVKKMEIELFDDKSRVAGLISLGLTLRYLGDLTFERVLLFIATYTAAEYDAVLLSWKEKVRHDRVRTTTVIQQRRYGTPGRIQTWAGPGSNTTTTTTIDASEFQPYLRIMPHAEYPSGSGCICQVNQDATLEYMKLVFNDTTTANFAVSTTLRAGSSRVEPGMTPAADLVLSYSSLDEIRETCGQSRLDGGMHFTAAVPDSYKLCSGMGPAIREYMLQLLNGSTDLLTNYVPQQAGGPPFGGPPPGVVPGQP